MIDCLHSRKNISSSKWNMHMYYIIKYDVISHHITSYHINYTYNIKLTHIIVHIYYLDLFGHSYRRPISQHGGYFTMVP
jgi:hypothetical protein